MTYKVKNEGVVDTPKTLVISDDDTSKSTIYNPVLDNNLHQSIKDSILDGLSRTPLKNTYVYDGKLYLVSIFEKQTMEISFKSVHQKFGKGPNKIYNPDAEYQRRGKQHTEASRQEILLALLAGENVGLIILKKNSDGTYDIVDGKQRMEIVKDFIQGNLIISPKKAANFWKLYLHQLLSTHVHDKEDKLKVNKILNKLAQRKYPKVVYKDLPKFIQNEIYENDQLKLSAKIADIQIVELGSNRIIHPNEKEYNFDIVTKAIFKKFIDINKNKAVIKAQDILWAAGEDCILENRRFLETYPQMGFLFGYTLKNKPNSQDLDDTDQVRSFMILLARASMLFQGSFEDSDTIKMGSLKWGDSPKKFVDMVLTDGKGDFTPYVQELFYKMISIFERGLFNHKVGPEQKEIQIPEEFTSQRSDILKLSYFLMMWYVTEYIQGKSERFLSGGEPKMRFLELVQKLSIYLTLGKLGNVDHNRWNIDKDLPLLKYNLKDEFYSEETFEGIKLGELLGRVKDLNIHQAGLSKDTYPETFRTLIKYVDSKLD